MTITTFTGHGVMGAFQPDLHPCDCSGACSFGRSTSPVSVASRREAKEVPRRRRRLTIYNVFWPVFSSALATCATLKDFGFASLNLSVSPLRIGSDVGLGFVILPVFVLWRASCGLPRGPWRDDFRGGILWRRRDRESARAPTFTFPQGNELVPEGCPCLVGSPYALSRVERSWARWPSTAVRLDDLAVGPGPDPCASFTSDPVATLVAT